MGPSRACRCREHGTFDFSLEGRQYQVDLSDENPKKFREALAPVIDVAEQLGAQPGVGRRRSGGLRH